MQVKMKQKIDIYLEPETIKFLEKEAYRTGISFSQLIDVAIEEKYKSLITKEVKLKCQH